MARVIWTEPALQELEAIADYIALDKPAAARNLVQTIFAKTEHLQRFPKLGKKPPELADMEYRQLLVSPCRVIYRLIQEDVVIVHVARDEQAMRWV